MPVPIRPYIYPYQLGSKSARALANQLNALCVRENGNYVPKLNHVVVNWGNSRQPKWYKNALFRWLNPLRFVEIAQDKLATFTAFTNHDVRCVEWTTGASQAAAWLKKGSAVIQRNLLNSHSGKGAVFIGYDEDTSTPIGVLSQAPLYTRYKKKAAEFRVHVFDGEVIDVQEKRKIKDFHGEANQYIRSHHNGWVYCREDIKEPSDLRSLAKQAVNSLGLDFGAADIIYNKHEDMCFALEVNTAPGLEGETINSYARAIQKLCSR